MFIKLNWQEMQGSPQETKSSKEELEINLQLNTEPAATLVTWLYLHTRSLGSWPLEKKYIIGTSKEPELRPEHKEIYSNMKTRI